MKKYLLLFLTILVLPANVLNAYSGGSGTAEEPFQIANAADLIQLGNTQADYGKCFELTANIDMAGSGKFSKAVIASGVLTQPDMQLICTPFTGIFNGNNFVIRNLSVEDSLYCGLFGEIGSGGVVSELGLENVDMTSANLAGGLCGKNTGGTLTGSYVTGTITGTGEASIGGLCGENDNMVTDCNSQATVTGTETSGGLCGRNSGSIIGSGSSGIVTGMNCTGGLCGWSDGSILNSYAAGTVHGVEYAGGLIGANIGIITSSYATSPVDGADYMGGFCGDNLGSIIRCYSTGAVQGYNCIGGFCGMNSEGGSITEVYAAGLVTGESELGGLCGWNESCFISSFWDVQKSGMTQGLGRGFEIKAYGLETSDMLDSETYTLCGWDFTAADGDAADWKMPHFNYPHLAWEKNYCGSKDRPYPTGDVNYDCRVNMNDLALLAAHWLECNAVKCE